MFKRHFRLLTLLALVLAMSAQPVHGTAEVQGSGGGGELTLEAVSSILQSPAEVPEWITRPVFQYSAAGRADPFSSFLKAQAMRQQRRTQDTTRTLSPLERFEVTQLKVVGIISNNLDPESVTAMVELPDGKGFVLRKGERVGMNHGRVVMISNDQVHVLEETEDLYGGIVNRSVVLRLQPAQGDRK
jgi:type IV pilus assembly protein PilP